MIASFSKGVARTAISMNPNLNDDEKKNLLAKLREDYSSSAYPEVPPGFLDGDVAKMFVDHPEFGKEAQEAMLLPEGPERRRRLKKLRAHLHKQHRDIQLQGAERKRLADFLQHAGDAIKDVIAWQDRPIVLQRPEGSLRPRLRTAVEDGEVYCTVAITGDHETVLALYNEGWARSSSFVVEHDWAAAFANATDFEHGDFPLPAPLCLFEFRITGLPVLVLASQSEHDDNLALVVAVRSRHGWVVNGTAQRRADGTFWTRKVQDGLLEAIVPDKGLELLGYLANQIRAISIALDAEVARKDVVRSPHRSNQPPRGKKPLPDYSYHVLSLTRRARAERAERDPNAEPGTRKRLHFRRGHWRHYAESKTWINWCLVGDPDLGFVDKHYKL